MKVLIIAKYIYKDNDVDFSRNKTGYGLMVRDIANSIAEKGNNVYVYTNVLTRKKADNSTIICSHEWKCILKSASINDWIAAGKAFIHGKGRLKRRLRLFYYRLDCGYLNEIIENIRPDIIHIHGISARTEDFIHILDTIGIPYCFTLHALIGLSDTVEGDKSDSMFEKKFFEIVTTEKIPVSLISSGMLKRIHTFYKIAIKNLKYFKIIFNGTDIRLTKSNIDADTTKKILSKYAIPENKKIILCLGNVCERKNQIVIPDIVDCLNDDILEKAVFVIAGRDFLNNKLDLKIEEMGLCKSIFNIGYVEKNDLRILQSISYGTMVVSVDEAFGLSIIEGYANGLPAIMYADLDASLDLYNADTCILVNDRTPECYAKKLTEFIQRNWDKEKIKHFANQFSLEEMASQYLHFYKESIEKYGERKNTISTIS